MQPRLIGLDIYRDFPVRADQPELISALENTDNLLVVCKGSNATRNDEGIQPPPEVESDRVGFSDFETDPDGVIRRHLFSMTQEPASPCQSSYSLSGLIALSYLSQEGIELQLLDDDTLQLGPATLTRLGPQDGGYQTIDAGGYQLLLNYRNVSRPEGIAERVTLGELLAGDVSETAARDRIVLIGTTAGSFRDSWTTPYSRSQATAEKTYGVFMQAHMISHLLSAALDGRPTIKTLPTWVEWSGILLATTAGSLIVLQLTRYARRRGDNAAGKRLLALLVTEVGLLGLCWGLFVGAGYWMPVVPSVIAPAVVIMSSMGSLRRNN